MEQINEIERLTNVVAEFEKTLNWKRGGDDLTDRTHHVLSQYKQIADNAISRTKSFAEDVRIQFKALEMITEGLTGSLNHGQKRTIANHIITMLREMVDRLSQMEYDYSSITFERYNFFRSNTPESKLHEERNNLKRQAEQQEKLINILKEKHPDIFKGMDDELPF